MSVAVRLFAAARQAAGTASMTLNDGSWGEVRADLVAGRPDLEKVLASCTVLVDGVRTSDPRTPIRSGALIDILPPFAGG